MRNAQKCAWLVALGLAVGTGALAVNQAAIAADDSKKDNPSLLEKMDRWQEKMTERFRDTWRGLWNSKDAKSHSEHSAATAAVDVREQQDSYIVRLFLPKSDTAKVDIKLEKGVLGIVAPAAKNGGRYEQSMVLSGIAPDAKLKIDRKADDHLIVVTVPKATPGPVVQNKPMPLPDSPDTWDRDIFGRMRDMQREMDRVFHDAFRDLQFHPQFKGWFDEPRFGSSVDLQDEGDKYVVRAYLPDRDMKDINVTVKEQTLCIEAKEETLTTKDVKGSELRSNQKAAFSQILTLPGPVEVAKMKVDRQEGMLIVTLPKAAS